MEAIIISFDRVFSAVDFPILVFHLTHSMSCDFLWLEINTWARVLLFSWRVRCAYLFFVCLWLQSRLFVVCMRHLFLLHHVHLCMELGRLLRTGSFFRNLLKSHCTNPKSRKSKLEYHRESEWIYFIAIGFRASSSKRHIGFFGKQDIFLLRSFFWSELLYQQHRYNAASVA